MDASDSCTNTRIEDCYIVSGDDCVAVKSGWDEYGIQFGWPTKQLVIRRLTCISPFSATIALGSEMSGGIENVRAEDITAIHTESGVRIKTAVGRVRKGGSSAEMGRRTKLQAVSQCSSHAIRGWVLRLNLAALLKRHEAVLTVGHSR